MHLLSTTTPDFVAWAILLYLVLRLLDSGEPRWWLAIGLCAGVAAEAKWTIWFLAAAVLAGFALTPQRRLLRSRYLLLGAVIAAALAAPDLIWQAAHGWPNLEVFRALQTAAGHNRATYWQAQVLFTGLALTPVWVAGLVWGLRNDSARRFRPAVIGAALAIMLQFVLGGKPYYSGGAYTVLLAAGSVPAGRWLFRGPGSGRHWGRWGLLAAGAVVTLAAVPIAIPVLPAVTLHTVPLQTINYDLAETIAWPREVALIAREYHALPAAQRDQTTILTGNYGEAGAVDRYGPDLGLPAAYSGSNNFWLWGPPPAADRSAIAINLDPSFLRREFQHVRRIAHVLQRPGGQRRRAGRAGLPGHRAPGIVGPGLAGVPRLFLTGSTRPPALRGAGRAAPLTRPGPAGPAAGPRWPDRRPPRAPRGAAGLAS